MGEDSSCCNRQLQALAVFNEPWLLCLFLTACLDSDGFARALTVIGSNLTI